MITITFASMCVVYSIRSRDVMDLDRQSVQWPMVNSLLLATIIRTGFVIISYGAKVPAGIFVPSMAIGATFGRMVGIIVKALYRFDLCLHWDMGHRSYNACLELTHNRESLLLATLTCPVSPLERTPFLALLRP